MTPIYIVIQPFDPFASDRQTIRVASASTAAAFGLDGERWHPAITQRPVLSIELMSPDLDGRVQAGRCRFSIDLNAFKNPRMGRWKWKGATVSVYSAPDLRLPSKPDFSGIISNPTLDRDTFILSVDAVVDIDFLDRPLLTSEFDGSSGLGGEAEMRGTLKPAGFGSCENIPPVWFDTTNWIGMLDGYGNTIAITRLMEGLNDFGASIGNYASYADLKAGIEAGDVPPGRWATCIAQGLVGLGAPPTGPIGVNAQFGHNRLGLMAKRILSVHAGVPAARIDEAAFDALDATVNRATHYWTADQREVRDLLEAMAASANATPLVTGQGLVTITRAVTGDPVATLDRSGRTVPRVTDWQSSAPATPVWRMTSRVARPASTIDLKDVNYVDDIIDRGAYSNDTVYRAGNVAWLPNKSSWLYTNETAAAGNAPPVWPATENAHWTNLQPPALATDLTYLDGTPIQDLQPAEAGSDVTGLHTSANTEMVGPRTATQVNQEIDNASASITAQGLQIDDILIDVSDLYAVYGDTASAAASASAAAAARDAAQQAQGLAEQAYSNAAGSVTAANAARDDAVSAATAAAGSEGAAAGFASTANSRADDAAGSATAAAGSATAANTSAGNAAVSASNAATSESNAAGSASSAASSASVTASTYQAAVRLTGNYTFDENIAGWTLNEGSAAVWSASVGGRSGVLTTPVGLRSTYLSERSIPVTRSDQRFRLRASHLASGPNVVAYLGYFAFDASGNLLPATDGSGNYPLAPGNVMPEGVWADRSVIVGPGKSNDGPYGGTQAFPAGTASFKLVAYLNYLFAAGQQAHLDYFTVEDVTGLLQAESAATASATSASAASASETAAGQSATAANTAKVAAETARGGAEAAQTAAATSESNAAGSASSAASSATVSATARDAARTAALSTVPDNFTDPSNWVNWQNWGGNAVFENGIAKITLGGSVYGKAHVPLAAGQTYRMTMRHRVINQGGGVTYLGAVGKNTGATIWAGAGQSSAPIGQWQTTQGVLSGDVVLSTYPSETGLQAAGLIGYPGISDGEITLLGIENITSEKAAENSASAAATSASAASASESAAGQSATAANTSAVNANTSAGGASSSASQAASSASSAAGSASAALASQQLAATFANVAGLIPNGNFDNGTTGWATQNFSWMNGEAPYGTMLRSGSGVQTTAYGPWVAIDPSRKYEGTVDFVIHNVGGQVMYAGLECADAYGNSLGNIYFANVSGHTFTPSAFYQRKNLYTGTPFSGSATSPVYSGGNGFVTGTVKARPVFLGNYSAVAGFGHDFQNFYLFDVTEREAASSSATAASSSAATASASAASATASAVLAASVAVPGLARNARFADYPNASGPPPVWASADNFNGGAAYRVAGELGGYAMRLPAAAGAQGYMAQRTNDLTVRTGDWLVFEADVTLNSGSFAGAGMYVPLIDTAGGSQFAALNFSAVLGNGGTPGRTYRFRGMHHVTLANASWAYIYPMSHWSGLGDVSAANDITWHYVQVRQASSAEIQAGEAIPSLQASVSTNSGAIASLQGRTTAFWQVEANAGIGNGATAFISARAETSPGNVSSTVAFGAREIHLYNPTSAGWMKSLSVFAGEVIVFGSLTASAGIYLGTGTKWQVALRNKSFVVRDGVAISYGLDFGTPPLITFSTVGLAPLNAGETYALSADNSTGTGFTPRLKISTPGTSTQVSLTTDTAPGTGPTRQIDKGANADAANNTYEFAVYGTFTDFAYYEGETEPGWQQPIQQPGIGQGNYINGSVTIGIWAMVAGAWSKRAERSEFIYQTVPSGGQQTVSWFHQSGVDLGVTGVQAFGVTIESHSGISAAVTDLASVSWTAQAASGERSATPSGQSTTAVVSPQ